MNIKRAIFLLLISIVSVNSLSAQSHIGDAVRNKMNDCINCDQWYYSNANSIAHDDWILDIPSVQNAPDTVDAHDFYSRIARMIENTEYTFEMSALYINADQRIAANYLAPALLKLHQKLDNKGNECQPYLRIVVSNGLGIGGLGSSAEDVWLVLTEHMRATEPDPQKWNFNLKVGAVGQIPFVAWNHSKVAVRDRHEMIVGGINMNDYYFEEEDGGTPLYDLSIHIKGDVAKGSSDYIRMFFSPPANQSETVMPRVWQSYSNFTDEAVLRYDQCSIDPDFSDNPVTKTKGDIDIYAIGRGFMGSGKKRFMLPPKPLPHTFDRTADIAIYAAIDSTQRSLYISQHMLLGPLSRKFVDGVANRIVQAALRGVEVKIILSNNWRILDPTPAGQAAKMQELLGASFPSGLSEAEKAKIRRKIQVAEFRATGREEAEKNPFLSHYKFMMFDDVAFYVTSQNLYSSAILGLGKQPSGATELNEFGLLVDNKELACEMKEEFWDIIWQQSRPLTAVDIPSTAEASIGNRLFPYYTSIISAINKIPIILPATLCIPFLNLLT